MPDTRTILEGLAGIANAWLVLAVLWHLYFGALAVLLLSGFRPSRRLTAVLLTAPLTSVGALAWQAGNPFNGTVFLLGATALLGIAVTLRPGPVQPASTPMVALGSIVFVFGWIYPHFLGTESYLVYAYAAPVGLVPCPTLSIATGLAIAFRGLESTAWSLVLGGLGLFYGVFGAVRLEVEIDWVLAVAALCLGTQQIRVRCASAGSPN